MPKWPTEELTWFKRDRDFEHESWWITEKGCLNDEHELLREGSRDNKSAIFRLGPIYWEILRRHPDLPKVRAAVAQVKGEGFDLDELSECLESSVSPEVFNNLLYLTSNLGNLSWPTLREHRGASSETFEANLPQFIASIRSADSVSVHNPNPVVDLSRNSASRLGELFNYKLFLKPVSVHVLEEMECPAGAEEVRRQILEIQLLRESLKQLGMEFLPLAIHRDCTPSAAAKALERILENHSVVSRPNAGHLKPDILTHIHRVHLNERDHDAMRELRKRFGKISFEREIRGIKGEI